jgi:hypothetical protein
MGGFVMRSDAGRGLRPLGFAPRTVVTGGADSLGAARIRALGQLVAGRQCFFILVVGDVR